MILTLFYPRELKQIIAELRAEDDLNEKALRVIHANIFLKISVLFLFLCSCLAVYMGLIDYVFFFAFAAFVVFSQIFLSVQKLFEKYMAVFVHGQLRHAIVDQVFSRAHPSNNIKSFRIRDLQTSALILVGPYYIQELGVLPLSKGDEVEYYISNNTNFSSMLSVRSLTEKYCLSKKLSESGE